MSYSVNWGDTSNCPAGYTCAANATAKAITQSSSFTHSYQNSGTYTITFTVSDSAGLTAQTTTTVRVGGPTPTPVCPVGYICTLPNQTMTCPAGYTCTNVSYNSNSNCPFGLICYTQTPITTPVSTQPSITVVSPNGGESFRAGDTILVRWVSSNIPSGNVDIQLYKGSQRIFTYPDTPNDGSENIILTSSLIPTSGSDYSINVNYPVGDAATYIDYSNSYFTITSGSVNPPLTIYTWVPSTQSDTIYAGQQVQLTSTYGGAFTYSCGQDGTLSGVTTSGTFYCTYSSSGNKTATISSNGVILAQKSFVVLSLVSTQPPIIEQVVPANPVYTSSNDYTSSNSYQSYAPQTSPVTAASTQSGWQAFWHFLGF